MTKWIIFAVIVLLVIIVAVSEAMEEEYYRGYTQGMADHENMMRKEKKDGKNDKSV